MRGVYRMLYHGAIAVGRPFGGLRPRRIYDVLGRRAYREAEFAWVRNRWGTELRLSHHYHIDRNILIYGMYDADLHAYLERTLRPGMVCMDVGANLGEMALHMALRVGATGKVLALEPAPAAYRRLCEHVERNGAGGVVRTFDVALAETSGWCAMGVPALGQDNQGLGSLVNTASGRTAEQARVRAMSLDDFVEQEKMERMDVIKIDIQGGEWGVLMGGKRALGRLRPELVMEISPSDLACAGKTSRDLAELLEGLGYGIYRMKRGVVGGRIEARGMRGDFAATNVVCRRAGP